jgi:hypothetical protein
MKKRWIGRVGGGGRGAAPPPPPTGLAQVGARAAYPTRYCYHKAHSGGGLILNDWKNLSLPAFWPEFVKILQ